MVISMKSLKDRHIEQAQESLKEEKKLKVVSSEKIKKDKEKKYDKKKK